MRSEPVDGPWELPDGWRWERLGDVAHIVAGQSPPSSAYNKTGQGLPFFQGKAEFGADEPTARKWCTGPTKTAEPGDVLISVRAPVGPTNIADRHCAIGRGLAAIRPREPDASTKWLRYWLLLSEHTLAEQGTGTTFAAISGHVLRNHPCPVTTPPVRDAIVARITALFAEIDEGEQALAAAREAVQIYRKALLKAAVTGELTADWREWEQPEETGSQLVCLVAGNRPQGEPRRGSLDEDETDEDAKSRTALPPPWCWSSIGELFRVCVGATPSRANPGLWNGTVPWVSSGEVAFCRIADTREHIARSAVATIAFTRLAQCC